MSHRKILLQNIFPQDIQPSLVFPTRFFPSSGDLKHSIKEFGILRPVCVFKTEKELCVLDGGERLKIAREENFSEIPCAVLEGTSLKEAFFLSLEFNRWDRSFNLIEKALLLAEAHQIFEGDIPERFWDLIDLAFRPQLFQQCREILALPQVIKENIATCNLPLATTLQFFLFPQKHREELGKRLFRLPMNANRLSEILEWLHDISLREGVDVLDLWDQVFSKIFGKDPLQKQEQSFREVLQKRKNPHYSEKLKAFQKFVSPLPFDHKKTRFAPAPFFEDDFVEVTTRFFSVEDVSSFCKTLQGGAWEEFFKKGLLQGKCLRR